MRYARITAVVSGVPLAILLGRFLHCQAIQAGLIRRFVAYMVQVSCL